MTDPPPEPPASGQLVCGYRLLRLIGRGAHGSVFLAADTRAPLTVALKLVTLRRGDAAEAARKSFMRSAATARSLVHPAIVTVMDAGVEGEIGWLAMEPVPGVDLSRYTLAPRLLPERLVLQVGRRVAQALAYAHRQGVVHRDLKPANVLVDWASDTLKLVDFDLARGTDAIQTGTGIVPGSPAYMAPEQLAGGIPTPRSDLYALGTMLFELLAGRLPHEATSMGELLRSVAVEPAPDLQLLCPALPPALPALVARMLAKQPAERPADAEEVDAALGAIAAAWPTPL
jgi:eukaryotic-like serine/threonine-protein kinase